MRRQGIDLEEHYVHESSPVRALVKELKVSDSGINQATLPRILRNLQKVKKKRVHNRDIREDNYKGGLLVDFGSSWTEPHCILDAMRPAEAMLCKDDDYGQFDIMAEDKHLQPTVRGLPNEGYCMKLRSWSVKIQSI